MRYLATRKPSSTFTVTGSLLTGRYNHTATLLPDGRVLVVGGGIYLSDVFQSTEYYDPQAGTFSAGPDMANARSYHTAILLKDGKVLQTGGQVTNIQILASVEVFDPVANTMSGASAYPPLPIAKTAHPATWMADGTVLLAGGYDGTYVSGDSRLYDPATLTYRATGAIGNPRANATATTLQDGRVLLAGGGADYINIGSRPLDSAEIYQ